MSEKKEAKRPMPFVGNTLDEGQRLAVTLMSGARFIWERAPGSVRYEGSPAGSAEPSEAVYADLADEANSAVVMLKSDVLNADQRTQVAALIGKLYQQNERLREDSATQLTALWNMFQDIRRDEARLRASQRLGKDSDGKQAAKREAKKLWTAWQDGKPGAGYPSVAEFCRAVVASQPVKSHRTVEKWCSAWRKERMAARRKSSEAG